MKMSESITMIGKDYHTVAMEHAYKLAEEIVLNVAYDITTRAIIIA